MKTERWNKVQEIFLEAAELPTSQRHAFVRAACGGDESLLGEVNSLLEADGGSTVLAEAVVHAMDDYDRALQDGDTESMVGRRIGPYRLTEIIGRGGMGAVYRALRDDDEFKFEVAIKLVKRGMDTDYIVQRFRAERQILARLEHPNIGRLLDGGATEDGLPYVVMELIHGRCITEHCADRKLPLRERLQLFRSVCSAVQYAHQNLIVHRDLKPSNILVSDDGTVKLLDFGIAKLLQPESLVSATLTGMRMLTPDYASPEQIRGGVITTAADIYSLGVVLYELLTDIRPHKITSNSPAEIEKVICEVEPDRPSVAVTRKTGITDRQRDQWRKALEGDLDNIIMMAMRKEPQRRYASAEQFSEDLRRHLSGLPVLARQDSVGYRASKFFQRNRFAVVAAVMLGITLVGGIGASTWQARRAEQRFQEVRKLANTVLFDFHEKIKDLPGTTEAQQLLVETVAQYLDRLVKESGGDPTLELELSEAYRKVGDAQGDPTGPNRGHTREALETYRKALTLAERVFAREPQNAQVRRSIVDCQFRIGDLELRAGQPTHAIASFETGLRLAEQAYAAGIRSYDDVRLVVMGYDRLGDVQLSAGRVTPAMQSYRKSLDLARTAEGPEPDVLRRLIGVASFRIADAQAARGDLGAALKTYQELLNERRQMAERNPSNTQFQRDYVRVLCYVGDTLGSRRDLSFGRYSEAADYYQRAVFAALQIAERDPKNARARRDLVFAYRRLAESLESTDLAQANTIWREALSMMEPLLTGAPRDREFRYDQALNMAGLASARAAQKDLSGAREDMQRALEVQKTLFDEDPSSVRFGREVVRNHRELGVLQAKAGDFTGARENLLESARIGEQLAATVDGDARLLNEVALTYDALGQFFERRAREGGGRSSWSDARLWFDKSQQLWRTWPNRAVAGPFVNDRLRAATLALAKCDHALGSLR
jgi:serine/threonine protein kinase